MTDRRHDDVIRAAFAQLRDTALPHIVPPGVGAARRAVRRRWFGAVAAAAGATAVVALGVGYLAGGDAGGSDGHGSGFQPAATPSPSPGPSPNPPPSCRRFWCPATPDESTSEPPDPGAVDDRGGENEAEERALDAVDFLTENGKIVPGMTINDGQNPPGSRYNMFFVDADEPAWSHSLVDTYIPRLETDSYLVRVWCGDEAEVSATVTLRAGDATATATAQCAMTEDEIRAGMGETTFPADSDHEIYLKVELDEAAWADGARPALMVVAIPQGVELPREPGPGD